MTAATVHNTTPGPLVIDADGHTVDGHGTREGVDTDGRTVDGRVAHELLEAGYLVVVPDLEPAQAATEATGRRSGRPSTTSEE